MTTTKHFIIDSDRGYVTVDDYGHFDYSRFERNALIFDTVEEAVNFTSDKRSIEFEIIEQTITSEIVQTICKV